MIEQISSSSSPLLFLPVLTVLLFVASSLFFSPSLLSRAEPSIVDGVNSSSLLPLLGEPKLSLSVAISQDLNPNPFKTPHPTLSLSLSVSVSRELKDIPFDLLEIIQEAQQRQQQQQLKNGTSSNSSAGSTRTERRRRSGKCSYTVSIKTSCSSPLITRDVVSLAFGEVHGNEVYAGRLDDPSSGTFQRCSTDTFKIVGPCQESKSTCYLYLRRRGRDGWTPEWVKVHYRPPSAVTFFYNSPLPTDVWYGFNLCNDDDDEGNQNHHFHPQKKKISGGTVRAID